MENEDFIVVNHNKQLEVEGFFDDDNELWLSIDDDDSNTHVIYLSKEDVEGLIEHLERVLKNHS